MPGFLLLVLALVLLAICAAPAVAKCEKDRCWGAVTFSRLTGYWAYSMNHPDMKSARIRAWMLCNKRCTNVVAVKNGCLALYVAPRGRYATSKGKSATEARDTALQRCKTRNKTCVFRVVRCTKNFEELKRRVREKARGDRRKSGLRKPARKPPARVEEFKL